MLQRTDQPEGIRVVVTPVIVAIILLITGCTTNLRTIEIRDLEIMSQDPLSYLDRETSQKLLLTAEEQQAQANNFLELYFSPWHTSKPFESTQSPFWAIDWIKEKTVFGENLRPIVQDQLQSLIEQASRESYPNLNRRAITVQSSDLRALPTFRPLFNDPDKAGEGFPFDNLQHSSLPANTPLYISHRSQDGAWVFAETALTYGWLPVTDLAWIDEDFAHTFESGRYLAPTLDQIAVHDTNGLFRFSSGLGSLLPLLNTETEGYKVLIAIADENRQALLSEARLLPSSGKVFPLPLTSWHLASLARQMVGQTYGWGGSLGNRDCSATIRDLFVPFGLWLPRNSAKQAKQGVVVPLSDLSPVEREKKLLDEGIPFLTLVRIPGHIMLYIGKDRERAALLHTIWGLRTKDLWGGEDRWVIGKTVITTLEPGAERSNPTLRVNTLLQKVQSMNLLLPASSP